MSLNTYRSETRKYFLALAASVVTVSAFAQPDTDQTSASESMATTAATVYDSPGFVPSNQVLRPEALAGDNWRVMEEAECDGFLYSFQLWTSSGWITPGSASMLRLRQNEADALAKLIKMQSEPLFIKGMTGSAKRMVKSTGTAISHPIDTLKKVPVGLGRFAGGMVARAQEGYTPGEEGTIIHLPAKRNLAYKIGVDPYTDNEVLQDALNTVSANSNYGALTFSIGTAFVGGWVGTGLTVAKWNSTALTKLRDHSGPELIKQNRKALKNMGCSEQDIEEFLEEKGYSVTRTTMITETLQELKSIAGINSYIRHVMPANRPEVSLYHQQQVDMVATYQNQKKSLTRLRHANGTIMFDDGESATHVFAPIDTVLWTPAVEERAKQILQDAGPKRTLHLWITGRPTARARAGLNALGIQLHEFTLKADTAKSGQ